MPPSREIRIFLLKVKAHEVRAVATSLQLFNKADLQAVMKAGRWSSGGTFTSFYLRNLCPQTDSIRRPARSQTQERLWRSPPKHAQLCIFWWLGAFIPLSLVLPFSKRKGGCPEGTTQTSGR